MKLNLLIEGLALRSDALLLLDTRVIGPIRRATFVGDAPLQATLGGAGIFASIDGSLLRSIVAPM